ncbi:hypothetical protein [Acinetobacter baumannii]|uniref:hypothetical protein n=1 Tax=Acinetobacter baumannii TaxID=470 RepID=UPI000DEC27DB|nr:hypothetical protein [Acinetobacter baumannii]EHU1961521.1 hypothetical protein [Acinetobacter baumannii]MBF8379850.1 hypothetical protein [Acinetobacter baumannii]MBJ3827427.1 hypothetical protein [Acinetobacter baumannii]MBP3075273.1 hypothetical protein [Acinetobacter baumannii]MBP5081275.1 hypothetical protein [Acinetobacter baumannii]
MFNFFKRPIVINFTVEQVHPDSKLCLIKTPNPISSEIFEPLAKAWKEAGFEKKVVVISKDINLETLTDDDLKKLGLKRIESDA